MHGDSWCLKYQLLQACNSHLRRGMVTSGMLPDLHAKNVQRACLLAMKLLAASYISAAMYFLKCQQVALCEDPRVLGTSFYVMEHVKGVIHADPSLPGVSQQERTQIYEVCLEEGGRFFFCLVSLEMVASCPPLAGIASLPTRVSQRPRDAMLLAKACLLQSAATRHECYHPLGCHYQ